MKVFENKFFVKLIVVFCLITTISSFVSTDKVYAKKGDDEQIWGGVLITPIVNLLTAVGDSIMEGLHTSIQSQRQAIIRIDSSEKSEKAWALFGAIVIGILAAVAFIALAAVGAAAIGAVLAKIAITAGMTFTIGLRNVGTSSNNRGYCRGESI